MKNFTLCILLLVSASLAAQQLRWVNKQGGNNPDQTNGIATDANGNVVAVGTFDATADFGNGISLTTSGSLDVFVAKYDSTGTCLWAKKAGGQFGEEGRAVTVDGDGNIYITGIYGQAGAAFDGINLGTRGGLQNGFVAKYTPSGNVTWVKAIGGLSSSPDPRKIKIGPNGKLYVAGDFYGSIDFDGQQPMSSMQPGGYNDVFIAQFDTAGAVLWANRGGDRKAEKVTGLTVDNNGNPIVYGQYDSLTTFSGTTKYAEYQFAIADSHVDMFLVKYTSSGGSGWFRSFGGGDADEGGGVCTDASGNVYTTGFFKGFYFTSGPVTVNSGNYTMFLHKLSSNGEPLWARFSPTGFGVGYQNGRELVCTGANIFLAGTFGADYKLGSNKLTGNGERNPILVKFDTSGNALWGMFGNGVASRTSQGFSVAVNGNRYYYAGAISGVVDFSGTSVTAPGVYTDGFISCVAEATVVPVIGNPTLLSVASATTTSVQLNWDGLSAEFRVLKKTSATSTSPTDGDVVYEGANKTFNLTGLTANTPYFITVYGKASGSAVYSATAKKIAATTVSDNPDTHVLLGFVVGETGLHTFGSTGVRININGASVSDGNISVDVSTALTAAGTLPVNIDSIFQHLYWTVTNTGLSGGSLRYCITFDVSDVWNLVNFLDYHLLKRPTTGAPWEDLMANSSYTVTRNSPEVTVCGLSTFSEFAVGMAHGAVTGIAEAGKTGQLRVYPNPASSFWDVELPQAIKDDLLLMNLQGGVVKTIPANGQQQVRIMRGDLPAGLYLLKAGSMLQKIMITD